MRRLFIAAALTAAMLVVPASQALGSVHHPKGEYAQFGECPLSHPALTFCLFSESSGGFFQIGKKNVPLKNPVTLQGGLEEEGFGFKFVGAEGGETLSKTPQPVPGGLLGIEAPKSWPLFLQELFNETINKGLTGVTATVELAAPASSIKVSPANLIDEEGDALVLPTKIKLSNSFLGSSCYIGSNASPVVINFTTGATSPPPPNKSIHGAAGTLSGNEAGTIITLSGGSLVNNSFAAPGSQRLRRVLLVPDRPIRQLDHRPAVPGRHQHRGPGRQIPARHPSSGQSKRIAAGCIRRTNARRASRGGRSVCSGVTSR